MKIIDLSHSMYSDMPVYPGDEPPEFKKITTISKEGYRETGITIYSHTGTHIDAPAHMLKQGNFLENIDIDSFVGKAFILDFTNYKSSEISLNLLIPYQEKIKKTDFVIIKTGWSKYWGKENYYKDYPFLQKKAAVWLSGFKLKGIGIDAMSIDKSDSIDFVIHKTLLSKNIIIIENLTNLESIKKESFILNVLPLKYKNSDGSPVRAAAIEDIE